uniref:Putative mitotic checkpoint protein prcc n=1 Tax=Triatoma dimidiata TaxID=72491 RepID=A0A0V0G7G5_TRIDM
MALVAYDCSDSSDYEDDDYDGGKNENNGKVTNVTLSEEKLKNSAAKEVKTIADTSSKGKVNDSLPPPLEIKSNFNVVSWALLSKNRTQPIRISVPSLEDEKDEEPIAKPKLKPSSSKSGLFAILPKPKQHLLIPPSLNSRKPDKKKEMIKNLQPVKTSQKSETLRSSRGLMSNVKEKSSLDKIVDDADEEEEQPQSFFFLPDDKNIPEAHTNEEIVSFSEFKESPSLDDNVSLIQEEPETSSHNLNNELQPMLPESPGDIELDKEALEKLCGRRGKRLAGEIEMVNVSGAELVGDSKLWLAKELTTQQVHFKRSKFDPLQRRKHQITFLAAQAREQELELSNQWANNRMTRKQTQAKYGF